MKIIVDEEIPLVSHYFGRCGEIISKPGRTLTRVDLLDADILLARSVTPINAALLDQTPVKFVGSTVTGIDHIDTDWLDQQGIQWAHAAGCNAQAVTDYVICAVAALQQAQLLECEKIRVGVIGVGKIGSRVAQKLKELNIEIIQYDPIRAENEKEFVSVPLSEFSNLDFITLHIPLTYAGKYPTFHMIEKNFLKRQKPGCVLLNTSRGAVIHSEDLKVYGRHLQWCFDVWENEPNIDADILKDSIIATQHIAGHSVQAKYRGIEMIYQKALALGVISDYSIPLISYPKRVLACGGKLMSWRDVVLQVFNLIDYSQYIKNQFLDLKKPFDELRKEFVNHDEFGFIEIQDVALKEEDAAVLKKLGFMIVATI